MNIALKNTAANVMPAMMTQFTNQRGIASTKVRIAWSMFNPIFVPEI